MVTFAETAEPFIKPAPRARAHVRSCTPSRSQQSNSNPAITLRSSPSQVRTRLGSCSKDPIGYVDGASLFEYVGGSALAMIDPSGLRTYTVSGEFNWSWPYISGQSGGPNCLLGNCPTTENFSDSVPWKVSFDASCDGENGASNFGNIQLESDHEIINSVGGGPFVTIDRGWFERLDARIVSGSSPSDKSLAKLKEEFGCPDCCMFSASYFGIQVALVRTSWWGVGVGIDVPTGPIIPDIDVNIPVVTLPSTTTVRAVIQMDFLHQCCTCPWIDDKKMLNSSRLEMIGTKVINRRYPRYADPGDVIDVPVNPNW